MCPRAGISSVFVVLQTVQVYVLVPFTVQVAAFDTVPPFHECVTLLVALQLLQVASQALSYLWPVAGIDVTSVLAVHPERVQCLDLLPAVVQVAALSVV